MNVLVVEQEDVAREELCAELSRMRFVKDVWAAASECGAEEILTHFTPDVIFLDMQLPQWGAFYVADRPWTGGIPVIVCITSFERRLVDALSRHRVEYLVRPFGTSDMNYVLTRGRTSDPIDPALNLKRLLDAAIGLQCPVRGRISTLRQGRSYIVDGTEVAAIRYDGNRFYLWTRAGVHETPGPAGEIENAIRPASFRRFYENALISSDSVRFGRDLPRAKWWLRRHHLKDILKRQFRPTPRRGTDAVFGAGTRFHDNG